MSFLLGPISGALVAGGVSCGTILAEKPIYIDLNNLGLLWFFEPHADAVRPFHSPPPKTNSLTLFLLLIGLNNILESS